MRRQVSGRTCSPATAEAHRQRPPAAVDRHASLVLALLGPHCLAPHVE